MSGKPQEVIQELINQFMELSGLIVKKTMEPLLAGYPDGITLPTQPEAQSVPPPPPLSQSPSPQPSPTQNNDINKPSV